MKVTGGAGPGPGGLSRSEMNNQKRSCFRTPTLHGEQPRRLPLNEDHDEDQHRDLRKHRARDAFEQLVEHAEAEAGDDRAGELTDAAEDDDEERIDDVALAEVGT